MATPLPPPNTNQSPDQHMQISRRFIEHAKDELAKGERLQASEKVWGAASHALTAFGKDRGWLTDKFAHKDSIAYLIFHEFDDPSIATSYRSFRDDDHVNFYQNKDAEDAIASSIASAESFVDNVQRYRELGPRPFRVEYDVQVQRINDVSGHRVDLGSTYTDGFINQQRLDRYQIQWEETQSDSGETNDDSEEGGASPVSGPDDAPPSGDHVGQALRPTYAEEGNIAFKEGKGLAGQSGMHDAAPGFERQNRGRQRGSTGILPSKLNIYIP